MELNDENLIFIVSQPRSGSTLLQAILSNNKYVETVNEPWLLFPFINLSRPDLVNAKYDFFLTSGAVQRYANKFFNENGIDKIIRTCSLNLYGALKSNATKFIIDKTPRYYEILPEIKRIFPNAKIIILRRNPMSVLKSIIETWGKDNLEKLLFYKRDILDAPNILLNFEKEHNSYDNVKFIQYEELVSEPKEIISSLYRWLDLPFKKEVLDYSNNKKIDGILGDPKISEYKEPHNLSANNWKQMLENNYWADFFKGYGNFLGKEILESYTELDFARKTKKFSLYKIMAEVNLDRLWVNKMKLLKYMMYQRFKIIL